MKIYGDVNVKTYLIEGPKGVGEKYRTFMVGEDEQIFLCGNIIDNFLVLILKAGSDGIPHIIIDRYIYLPMEWLKNEYKHTDVYSVLGDKVLELFKIGKENGFGIKSRRLVPSSGFFSDLPTNLDKYDLKILHDREQFALDYRVRKCANFRNSVHDGSPIFDHVEEYKTETGYLFITSPYGNHEEEAKRLSLINVGSLYNKDATTYCKIFKDIKERNQFRRILCMNE